MTKEDKQLIDAIVEGMQEQKAKNIVVVDMTKLEAPCSYFVICDGTSSRQVASIADTMRDYVRDNIRQKPFSYDGYENAEWIALDYGSVIAHIFQHEIRMCYDIEHLWNDAKITHIPDID